MIHAFPKIFAIGQDYIQDIFKEEVSITEKIDGSQLDFGKVNDELFIRSKGKQLFIESPEKMFQEAIDYVLSIEDKIENNTVYYCEYLRTPRHNVLAYERVPKNHLILFGISNIGGTFISEYNELEKYADKLDIEVVPLIYKGLVERPTDIFGMLDVDSVLGNTKIEGIVVKNYERPFLLGGQPIPLMMGKYVSEKFKEIHNKSWNKEKTSKGKWETYCDGFRTEARWDKSIQHLRDNGDLENAPKDIGKLIQEIKRDIEEEEKENVKEFLWSQFGKDLIRKASRGFPEYYKEKLMKDSFTEEKREV